MSFEKGFLDNAIRHLRSYKTLGDKTLAQLEEQDLRYQPSSESNSIAIIIKHMHGNMLSRWTNFLTEDGEKPWRQRDAEFEDAPSSKTTVMALWEEGWQCLFNALTSLTSEDLTKDITIRTEPLKVYDAILRQIAHYSSHVGQILYIGKLIRNEQWQPLSIPKGGSKQYLDEMRSKQQPK